MGTQLACEAGTHTVQDMESIARNSVLAGTSYVAANVLAYHEQARRENVETLGQL